MVHGENACDLLADDRDLGQLGSRATGHLSHAELRDGRGWNRRGGGGSSYTTEQRTIHLGPALKNGGLVLFRHTYKYISASNSSWNHLTKRLSALPLGTRLPKPSLRRIFLAAFFAFLAFFHTTLTLSSRQNLQHCFKTDFPIIPACSMHNETHSLYADVRDRLARSLTIPSSTYKAKASSLLAPHRI